MRRRPSTFAATALLAGLAHLIAAPLGTAQTCQRPAFVEHLGGQTAGTTGVPRLEFTGSPIVGRPFDLRLTNALPGSVAVFGASTDGPPFLRSPSGAILHAAPPFSGHRFAPIGSLGSTPTLLAVPTVSPSACGLRFYVQALAFDPQAAGGLAFSAGL